MPRHGGDVVTVERAAAITSISKMAVSGDREGPNRVTAAGTAWPDRNPNGLRSAMYEGVLVHSRFGPGPTHSFNYKVAMPLLDLAEVDEVMGLHPAWSARWPAPVTVPA